MSSVPEDAIPSAGGAPVAGAPPALRLLRLRVRRTPGIEEIFALGDLSSGVNLVHGPNASGKTSTARAIEAVLWPDTVAGPALSASADYALGNATYHVEIDAGHVGIQRDGVAAPAPGLPAPELRQRYHLSLHDLLAHDRGEDFAAEIARQSTGGYDLGAAERALGFRARPSAATNESRALEQARERLKDATDAQARLHQDARELDDLARRRDDARRAGERATLLAHAVRHARLAAEAAEARSAIGAFPEVLTRLRGNEYDALGVLRQDSRKVDDQLREATAERDDAATTAAELLPDGPPSGDTLRALAAEVETLRQQEQAVAEAERRERDFADQAECARRDIGDAVDEARLACIDGVTFGELSSFAREAEHIHAEATVVEAELRRAGEGAAEGEDLDTVRAGARLLAQWLADGAQVSPTDRRTRSLLWVVAGIAGLGWVLFGLRWHVAASFVGVLPVVIAFLATRRPAAADPRAARERDYEGLGLPRPDAWDVERVRGRLDALHKRIADGEVVRARTAWHGEARQHQAELSSRRRDLEARRVAIVERFGVAPDTDERQLSWLADRIGRWQDASRARSGASGALDAARAQRAAMLAAISDRLRAFGYPAPADAADAQGAADDLERRVREHRTARERERSAKERLAALDATRRELADRCTAIFASAGVSSDDDAALAALCAQCEEFAKVRERLTVAEQKRDAARAELQGTAGFTPDLLERAAAEVEAERADAEARGGELEALTERVSVLRAEVERASQGSGVETALAAVAAAEAELRVLRERDLRAMVGDLLVRHVQKVTRDHHRPEVFHRARTLFARITRGRYRLEFADGDEPAFHAVDVETGRGHALDELSSATRVQLLLAVRVAFVETQEHGGTRLPLLLDETLGTSDDQRAEAIIDAVITLAEHGRQIFYFTAQRDEVGKWLAALEARGAPHTCVDLAKARQLVIDGPAELPMVVLPAEILPPPDGHTHAEYGALLGVQPLRPGAGSADAAPLWYVVDDVRALHHFLSLGVSTWGALHNLIEGGGLALVEPFPKAYARATVLARALGAYLEQAAIGRGKPVSRAVLAESGAVSDRLMERVAALLQECGGHARSFLDALEAGRAQNFQRKKAADLREYLEREGYLDTRSPRTPQEVRAAALGAAAFEIAAGRLTPEDVDALLRRAATPPSPTGADLPSEIPAVAFSSNSPETILS